MKHARPHLGDDVGAGGHQELRQLLRGIAREARVAHLHRHRAVGRRDDLAGRLEGVGEVPPHVALEAGVGEHVAGRNIHGHALPHEHRARVVAPGDDELLLNMRTRPGAEPQDPPRQRRACSNVDGAPGSNLGAEAGFGSRASRPPESTPTRESEPETQVLSSSSELRAPHVLADAWTPKRPLGPPCALTSALCRCLTSAAVSLGALAW